MKTRVSDQIGVSATHIEYIEATAIRGLVGMPPLIIQLRGYETPTDVSLSSLKIGTGRRGTRSIPVRPSGTDYKTWVPNDWSSVTVQATQNDDAATVAITGDTDTSTPNEASLGLNPGLNTVTVTVTAEDTTTIKTYTVTVLRLAGCAGRRPGSAAEPRTSRWSNTEAGRDTNQGQGIFLQWPRPSSKLAAERVGSERSV